MHRKSFLRLAGEFEKFEAIVKNLWSLKRSLAESRGVEGRSFRQKLRKRQYIEKR